MCFVVVVAVLNNDQFRQSSLETKQPYVDSSSIEDRKAIEQRLRLTIILYSTCSEATQIYCVNLHDIVCGISIDLKDN